MKKLFFLILSLFVLFGPLMKDSAKADFSFGAIGGAVSYGSGFYNPVMGGFGGGFNPYWGGGYNLNSLQGGGWGGYPAGYGVPFGYGPGNGFGGGIGGAGGCNGGALTGGFGGFYSPFVR
ncbi:MAG: hypothetical protein SFU25_07795 [Candidatus Caenarcaniphilales bacterium]|nr:hypothetical protein [Candidatus Caenarcaniphilales bacterium]